jgi:hypothetical protein
MKARLLGSVLVPLLLLCVGCAGSASYLHAKGDLKGPISLTPAVYDADGRLLHMGYGLEEVAPFKARHRYWSVMMLNFGPSWDLTALVNRRLEETGGDAVVDVKTTIHTAFWQNVAMWLLVVPTYFDVVLDGKIVRATELPPLPEH